MYLLYFCAHHQRRSYLYMLYPTAHGIYKQKQTVHNKLNYRSCPPPTMQSPQLLKVNWQPLHKQVTISTYCIIIYKDVIKIRLKSQYNCHLVNHADVTYLTKPWMLDDIKYSKWQSFFTKFQILYIKLSSLKTFIDRTKIFKFKIVISKN